MKLAITGVFCSGKTTIAKEFKKLGFKIINADKVGHKLLNRKDIKTKVIKKFGNKILTNKRIDRKKLKNIVFYNKNKLKTLNRIIHPEIVKEIKKQIKRSKNKNIVIDAALIIEFGKFDYFDKLVVIKINKKNQIKRALKKGKYNKEEINNIIKSQLSQNKKLKYADYIIDNNKPINNVKKQIKDIIKWQK